MLTLDQSFQVKKAWLEMASARESVDTFKNPDPNPTSDKNADPASKEKADPGPQH